MAAKKNKKKAKLTERINQLENELKTSLQKKAAGPAINVAKYTSQIQQLKKELVELSWFTM